MARGTKGSISRVLMLVALLAIVLWLAHVVDYSIYRWAANAFPNKAAREQGKDWYQALRQFGSVVPWIVVAGAFLLAELSPRGGRGSGGGNRGGYRGMGSMSSSRGFGQVTALIIVAVLIGGGIAELLKPLISRRRPEDTEGLYVFWSWSDPLWRWSDCGIPSSHAAVAFAGAWAIAILWPRTAWILLPVAIGTAYTRVITTQHFFSDVVLGAMLGIVSAMIASVLVGVARPNAAFAWMTGARSDRW